MKKILLAILFLGLAAALCVPGATASSVATPFLIFGPTQLTLAITGQQQCGIQLNGPPQSVSATPQFSSNGGATWTPATGFNQGQALTSPGFYYSANPNPGLYTAFGLNVTSFTGTQLSGQLICGDGIPPTPEPGASGPPGGVTTISATAVPCGQAVSVPNPTPSPVVEVPVCATSSPAPTVTSSGAPITTSFNAGTNVYSIGCNNGAANGCLTNVNGAMLYTVSPTANPTTQPGYIQVTGGLSVGPQPAPIGTFVPNAINVASLTACTGSNYARWGTTSDTADGVVGNLFAVGCPGAATYFTLDANGDAGVAQGLTVGSTALFNNQVYISPTSSGCGGGGARSLLFACTGGLAQISFGASATGCFFDWNDGISLGMVWNCPMAMEPRSNGSTQWTYVPPVFTHTGGITPSTLHGAQFSCTFSTALSCNLGAAYFTNGAVFVTISGCDVATTATDGAVFSVGSISTNTAIIYSSIVTSDTVTGICWGS